MLVEGTTPLACGFVGLWPSEKARAGGCVVLTALALSSAGVTGMFVVASCLRVHALRMFFILGAS